MDKWSEKMLYVRKVNETWLVVDRNSPEATTLNVNEGNEWQ